MRLMPQAIVYAALAFASACIVASLIYAHQPQPLLTQSQISIRGN